MQILFYDVATPLAYDFHTLQQQGLGGTEATIIRVAHALKNHHQVAIAQHCRTTQHNQQCEGVDYLSLESAQQLNPEIVILLRNYRLADTVGKLFPRAQKFLWLHNMPSLGLHTCKAALLQHQFHLIAVSHFHRQAIERRLRGRWYQRALTSQRKTVPVSVLYNPIDEHLIPDATPWQAQKLLFMSSPQKGLPYSLKCFEQLQQHFPEYQLFVSNPGYHHSQTPLPAQASFLGSLPHQEVIRHLRESFCVFYPQYERVETFGLIYAEANAVGTPVLAHAGGAASEVLSDPEQLVNGRDFSSVLKKIEEWRIKRPSLQAKPEFRINRVTQAWLGLLAREAPPFEKGRLGGI